MMMTDLIAQINDDMLARKEASVFVKKSSIRSRTNAEIMAEARRQVNSECYRLSKATIHNARSTGGLIEFEEIAVQFNMEPDEVRRVYANAMSKIRKMVRANKDTEKIKTVRECLLASEQTVIDQCFFHSPH